MITAAPTPRIAVILPVGYRGGTLRLVLNTVRHFAAVQHGKVVFGIPDGHQTSVEDELAALKRDCPTAEIRPFTWKRLNATDAAGTIKAAGLSVDRLISDTYQIPVDARTNFCDCDFWFFISDRLEYPLIPLRPYGILVTDHLQRYVPDIFELPMYRTQSAIPWNFIRNVRNADLVVATSEGTLHDVQSFSGCLGSSLRIPTTIDLDHFLQLVDMTGSSSAAPHPHPYCAWVTNSSQHKNHPRMIRAIRTYYESLGGDLDILVTGLWTDLFDPNLPEERIGSRRPQWDHPYIRDVREQVRAKLGPWQDRIHWKGSLDDRDYVSVIRHSRFLIHNVIADNGTFSVVEAAILGRPSVSSDYPQMRELDEQFGLGMTFFDPTDSAGTAQAMHHAESLDAPDHQATLEQIQESTWQSWDDSMLEAITSVVSVPRREIACL
jgi:glycosyltransferase involved in cell wall biosynthesis